MYFRIPNSGTPSSILSAGRVSGRRIRKDQDKGGTREGGKISCWRERPQLQDEKQKGKERQVSQPKNQLSEQADRQDLLPSKSSPEASADSVDFEKRTMPPTPKSESLRI